MNIDELAEECSSQEDVKKITDYLRVWNAALLRAVNQIEKKPFENFPDWYIKHKEELH